LTTGERKIAFRSADNTQIISINEIKYAPFFLIALIVSDAQKMAGRIVTDMQLHRTIQSVHEKINMLDLCEVSEGRYCKSRYGPGSCASWNAVIFVPCPDWCSWIFSQKFFIQKSRIDVRFTGTSSEWSET
jgi:hypothetical protein